MGRYPEKPRDEGFGIVEIIVALALLGLLAAALAPMFASSLALTTKNAVLAYSNQLANERLEDLRASATCATGAGAPYSRTDGRGVVHTVTTTVDATTCTSNNLLKVSVQIATNSSLFSSQPVVTANTTIWVH